jgi:hypothetical protein
MADVALYFDDSGFGGTAGSEDGWAAVANWQAGLGDGDYPTLSHLIENGWEDDLPGWRRIFSRLSRMIPRLSEPVRRAWRSSCLYSRIEPMVTVP